jgi:hypothetical protein
MVLWGFWLGHMEMLEQAKKSLGNDAKVCYKHVTGVLQECHHGVTRVLWGCYVGHIKVLQQAKKSLGNEAKLRYKGVTGVLQECYKSVKRVYHMYSLSCNIPITLNFK